MTLVALLEATLLYPALWITSTMLWQLLTLLLLTVVYRACTTLLVLRLPVDHWFRRRQLAEPQANQLILITGATSGIGLALAKHLHKLGYSVLATYCNSSEPGFDELERLAHNSGSSAGPRMFLQPLDVRQQNSISAAYQKVEEEILRPHKMDLFAIVNNAGLGSLQPFAWLQRESIINLIETNITGNLLVTREFLPLLVEQPARADRQQRPTKRILFVSSGLGLVPGATYATYGITKTAQIYFAKCLNLELKKQYRVQSVAVIPHNFIKNTSICALNIKNNQEAWEEMRPIERKTYLKQFKQHNELAKLLERATHAHLVEGSTTSRRPAAGKQRPGPVVEFLNKLIGSLKGENIASSLEESGVLEGFELALRLRNPPELIFAGDSIFQLLMGSLVLVLPSSFTGLLSGSVTTSLYR